MKTEIGSYFWEYALSTNRDRKLWWESKEYNSFFFKSGRNAIKAVCGTLSTLPKRILFPAYHCQTETEPWYEAGWIVDYYPIREDCSIDHLKLEKYLTEFQPSVLFIQSYYGFYLYDSECEKTLKTWRNTGGVVIEDITQSLMSDYRLEYADYYVASLRKFFAIPDGGVLISKTEINLTDKQNEDTQLLTCALEASRLKKYYFSANDLAVKDAFLSKYSEYEELIRKNDRLYDICNYSLNVFRCFNYHIVASRRRNNFEFLSQAFGDIEYFAPLLCLNDATTVPLYFPVLLNDAQERDPFRRYLADVHSIYCPIIWPRPLRMKSLFASTEFLYSRILCFPIDQRYDNDDMKRTVAAVRQWKGAKTP